MRVAWVIILLVIVGATLARLRSQHIAAQAQLHRLEAERLKVRRQLWDQQLRLGRLRAPRAVQRRRLDMALELTRPHARPEGQLAAGRGR